MTKLHQNVAQAISVIFHLARSNVSIILGNAVNARATATTLCGFRALGWQLKFRVFSRNQNRSRKISQEFSNTLCKSSRLKFIIIHRCGFEGGGREEHCTLAANGHQDYGLSHHGEPEGEDEVRIEYCEQYWRKIPPTSYELRATRGRA